jgi:hypothetical protein
MLVEVKPVAGEFDDGKVVVEDARVEFWVSDDVGHGEEEFVGVAVATPVVVAEHDLDIAGMFAEVEKAAYLKKWIWFGYWEGINAIIKF